MTTTTQSTTLDEKVAQLDSLFQYLGVEPERMPLHDADGPGCLSYLWWGWFEAPSLLELSIAHFLPATIVTVWEPMGGTTASAMKPFFDTWAVEHPDITVVTDPQGVRLSMEVVPAPDWTNGVWEDYLHEVWAHRLGFLSELKQYASAHGLDHVLPEPEPEGGLS